MRVYLRYLTIALCSALLATSVHHATAQEQAEIVNDEGGPVVIHGEYSYTNAFFRDFVTSPIVILEDQAGFIDRNQSYVIPVESQILGQITSDVYASPFTYTVSFPIEPQGTSRDVDNDNEDDPGVMVFAVAYWNNIWGDPYLEVRDLGGGGWSTDGVSTRTSTDASRYEEIVGGKLVIYTPDDSQGFPSSFGQDGLLFTDDDPIVTLPQGWTVVNLDTDPFTFDRSREQTIDLIEAEGAALDDFSALPYSEAFDAMLDKFRHEYAFTDFKGIDWDAKEREFRPRFVEAEQNDDEHAYLNALRDFIYGIPDGHVGISPIDLYLDQIRFDIARGLGLAVRETDDGRVLVTYLLPGGPADEAGIELGAEILEMNEKSMAQIIDATQPNMIAGNFSSPHTLRLAQETYSTRFNDDTESVDVIYQNSGDNEPTSVTLLAINEFDSLFNNSEPGPDLTNVEFPVEYRTLDNGYGYVAIYSFLDNFLLTVQIWERMIAEMNSSDVPGLIVDLRYNGGGNGFLADQLAGYFFDQELVVGMRGRYSSDIDDFYFNPTEQELMYPPADVDLIFHGPVVVLVGPNCASACERIAYDLTLQDRAAIVGQFPTAGLGGGVEDFLMPSGITIRMTIVRSTDAEGNIHIEGQGVAPTVVVPVNEDTLFSDADPILDFAEAYLSGGDPFASITEGGEIEIGDTVTGEFTTGQRDRYTLRVEAGVPFDIFLGDEAGELTTVLRVYDLDENLLFSNESEQTPNSGNTRVTGLESNTGMTVIIEAGTYNDELEGPYILSVTESN